MSENKKVKDQTVKRLIDALLAGGLAGINDEFDRLIEQNIITFVAPSPSKNNAYQESNGQIRDILSNDGLAGFVNCGNSNQQEYVKELVTSSVTGENVESGSIYASEYRELAVEENQIGRSQVDTTKTRVLEPARNRTPNAAWEGLETVSPGQLKL